MGEKSITTQVKIDGDIVPDFSRDWEVEFQGEKYIMPLRIPQGAKENTSLNSTIDLTFQHWAIYQLKRWPFVTIQQIAAGTYLPDEEVASVSLNLKDFCILFGQVLEYYYGDAITIDLNPAWEYDNAATAITISHTKIWNVLAGDNGLYKLFGVRWEIKAAADNSNTVKGGERYVIRVGYPTTEVDHIFEYGFEGGLLKVERQVQSEEIRNMLKGRGGDTNIPLRYFKDTDPNNKDFRPDPDWVEELANIYFPNLMPATFRSYVQGWKAAHINQTDADGKKIYAGYTPVGEDNAYAPWAYRKGYTDTKFSPVEFVADEITINPTTGDKQVEILPGYSPFVKKGSSIDKYGPLPDTLDNNDDIYPTLQGTGLDIAVDVEQIESDDVAESTENDAKISNIKGATTTVELKEMTTKRTITVEFPPFDVPDGQTANIVTGAYSKKAHYIYAYVGGDNDVTDLLVISDSPEIIAVNALTGAERSASRIPAGRWKWKAVFKVELVLDPNVHLPREGWITVGYESPKLQTASLQDSGWRNTFDIWVKNIWDSARLPNETPEQYAERVWKPVLGDRESNTAKVVFTSGALAVSEDYEFTIVDFPVPDTSKTWEEKNEQGGVIATHTSHWRIKLAKSDAELETTGLYVPSTQKQGKAGDRFVFIGTEMTHVPYVVDAEVRQADWLKDQLGEVKEIKPTAVVTTDRVRLSNEGKPNALINQLRVGNSLRLFDKRFFNEEGKAYETLYLQSITYTYREPTKDDAALNPDVQIVLGDEYTTSANPVSMMQSEINALHRQVGSISNIEQIVRAVGDRLYLRKDGISDRSLSPTQFFSLLTSGDFRAGLVGGAGWGFFKDENGNWVLEADRVNVRQEMQVNTLVINQAEGRGGLEVDTAAFMSVTRVDNTADGYICYFDQKGGSIGNLFHVDDVAFCNQWTPDNAQLKFYKRRVTAVGTDNITLSKTDVNGTGIPAEGDTIIHFGNYTDATRQYVKVRDVVGGGYERYIEVLNSVDAEGVEYYFIGKQAGESRWFVGNKDLVPYSGDGDGSYIEYINRKFNLHNVTLSIGTTIGDTTIGDLIEGYDASKYLREALPQNTDIEGGVILSTLLSLGYTDSAGLRHTMAGMNGSWIPELGGRTIAAWYGGPMVDLFDKDGNRLDLAAGTYAASLDRMDGSGYKANGNFRWKEDGTVNIGDETYGITLGSDGRIVLGNGISINIGGNAQGLGQSIASVTNLANKLSNLFTPYIGTSDKNWSEITDVSQITSVKINAGVWTDGFMSARGLNPNGGTSGGAGKSYLSQLLDVDLSTLSSGQVLTWNGTKWTNSVLTLPDMAGYALESWVEANFVTLDTAQTITGIKTFDKCPIFNHYAEVSNSASILINKPGLYFGIGPNGYADEIQLGVADGTGSWFDNDDLTIRVRGMVTATSFAVQGGTASQFLKADGSVDSNAYLTTESASTSYVSKAGDSMTGALNINNSTATQIWLNSNGAAETGIGFKVNSATLGWVGYNTYRGTVLYTYDGGHYLGIHPNGTPRFDSNVIWHQGNDGSGSGLDADLLDGNHLADILASNVASASRLQTARTIWGHDFDGTGNVSGTLLEVEHIIMSGGIISGGTSQGAYIGHSGAGLGDTYTGGLLYAYGNNPLYFYTNSLCRMMIDGNGNVGIGTDSSAYKLDVNGAIRTTALVIGDCTISWNATNRMLKVDRGLYSEGGVSAHGVNTNAGSGSGNYMDVNASNATYLAMPNLVAQVAESGDLFPYDSDYFVVGDSSYDYDYCAKFQMTALWRYIKKKADQQYVPTGGNLIASFDGDNVALSCQPGTLRINGNCAINSGGVISSVGANIGGSVSAYGFILTGPAPHIDITYQGKTYKLQLAKLIEDGYLV